MFRTAAHAINNAHDEQPNDRQGQPDQDKCHPGTDNHCEHAISPDFLFCTSTRHLVEQKGARTAACDNGRIAQECANIGSCRPSRVTAIAVRSSAAT
jgi:hypothetical protein